MDTEIRVREVFNETQRGMVKYLLKANNINFINKSCTIKRADGLKVHRKCNYITLKMFDVLIEKLEKKYTKTKNFNTKESLKNAKNIRKHIQNFIKGIKR